MAFAEHLTSAAFKENAREALADPQLQSALHGIETGIIDRRRATVSRLPEFEALRDSARDIKNHTLAHLDLYLEQFEQIISGDSETAGRTLDFLAQELLREANTIASKSNDAQISRAIVEVKGTIDRIKEQVQNVE